MGVENQSQDVEDVLERIAIASAHAADVGGGKGLRTIGFRYEFIARKPLRASRHLTSTTTFRSVPVNRLVRGA